MATIFLVDDDTEIQNQFAAVLRTHRLISATTGKEAFELFDQHKDEIDIALLDGYFDKNDPTPDTLVLIAYMRRTGFSKPMIAMSSDGKMCNKQLAAGCSHSKHKFYVQAIVGLVNTLT